MKYKLKINNKITKLICKYGIPFIMFLASDYVALHIDLKVINSTIKNQGHRIEHNESEIQWILKGGLYGQDQEK